LEPGWGDATPATASATITGTEQRVCLENPDTGACYTPVHYRYDSGTVTITVNNGTNLSKSTTYNSGSTGGWPTLSGKEA
jgi:hypothetical protein